MNPREVLWPKSRIGNGSLNVVYGDSENAVFSIAIMQWEGVPRVGLRWNNCGKKGKGYPVGAFGRPQWFIIPKEMALAYAKQLNNVTIIEKIKATSDDPLV